MFFLVCCTASLVPQHRKLALAAKILGSCPGVLKCSTGQGQLAQREGVRAAPAWGMKQEKKEKLYFR